MTEQKFPYDALKHTQDKSDMPAHTPGSPKGEQKVRDSGREPGREDPDTARTARDSTSIDPQAKAPIVPSMPHIPPA